MPTNFRQIIKCPNRQSPIGVFDSGVGGLSVLRVLRQQLPRESFIYVADSGYAPYGDRSAAFILERARTVTGFLVAQKVKALVIACNTASGIAASILRAEYDIPIVAMEPAIKPATLLTKSKVVLVLATSTTIASQSVARLCEQYGTRVKIILQACPGLSERVDQGAIAHTETRRLLEQYICPSLAAGADTIVLGCSHYPFLAAEIAAIAGPSVNIIDPASAVAGELVRRIKGSVASQSGCVTFYTSGATQALTSFLHRMGETNAEALSFSAA